MYEKNLKTSTADRINNHITGRIRDKRQASLGINKESTCHDNPIYSKKNSWKVLNNNVGLLLDIFN